MSIIEYIIGSLIAVVIALLWIGVLVSDFLDKRSRVKKGATGWFIAELIETVFVLCIVIFVIYFLGEIRIH